MDPRNSRAAVRAAALGLFLSSWLAAPAAGQNLLTNPSFESDLTGWTVVQSNPSIGFYGFAGMPSTIVSGKIGGETRLLVATSHTLVEQPVSLATVTPGQNLRVGGSFGGRESGDAGLLVLFLDASGSLIQPEFLEFVTREHRNDEWVLMRREKVVKIPVGAVTAVARVELRYFGGSSAGFADTIFVEPTSAPTVPPPLPTDTELLVNGDFESGWSANSPLVLDDAHSWHGLTLKKKVVKPYSNSDPTVPGSLLASIIGGGGRLLADSGGGGVLRQWIDARGNAAQFASGSLALRSIAYLGGIGTDADQVRLEVQFLDESLGSIVPTQQIDPVSAAHRNAQTTLLKRERDDLVPAGTAYIVVDLVFDYFGGNAGALVDNVSARLVAPTPPVPVALNANLVVNGSFETGPLPGSPLTPNDPQGWFGLGASCGVLSYGSGANVPSSGFATSEGLGGAVLKDWTGNGGLSQVFDVSADAAAIDAGRYRTFVGAWLGGATNDADWAEVWMSFQDANGVQVGGTGGLVHLPPVTAAERNNQTKLLPRSADVAVPAGTRSIRLELRFGYFGGTVSGLADDVRLVVYDTLFPGPVTYPGTGEDLRLFSGVNAQPTTGPGSTVKSATAGDVLDLRVESPDGTFDYAPLLIAANVHPTGSPPPPSGLPGLELDPFSLIFLVNGVRCGGFGCAAVLPGGTVMNFPIPPGFVNQTVRLQAFALPLAGATPPANEIFVGTEAHEIDIH